MFDKMFKITNEILGSLDNIDENSKPVEPTVLVIDKNTGCHFFGYKLIHTDECRCDEDYDRGL